MKPGTKGQAHDGRSADDMLDGLGNGDVLLGDRAYDSDATGTVSSQRTWRHIGRSAKGPPSAILPSRRAGA